MRVLVVDDDPMIRRILGRLLVSTFGVELVEAENGVEGLIQLETNCPDLLLMDVAMPMMDGLEMLAAIRASPKHRNLPVVAVSVSKNRTALARLIELQIQDYLLKPFDIDTATERLTPRSFWRSAPLPAAGRSPNRRAPSRGSCLSNPIRTSASCSAPCSIPTTTSSRR